MVVDRRRVSAGFVILADNSRSTVFGETYHLGDAGD